MIIVIDKPATKNQIKKMLSGFGNYIKVVVDVEKKRLAGGGELHVDCEKVLLESGSRQEDLWGGGVAWEEKRVEFNSLTNIRPKQGNSSQEILDPLRRKKFAKIVKKLLNF